MTLRFRRLFNRFAMGKNMKMKTTLIAASIVAMTAAAPAMAEPFNGFSVGLGVAAVGADTTINAPGDVGDLGLNLKVGETTTVGVFDAAYAYKVNNQWSVALGATYDLNNAKSGNFMISGNDGSMGASIELKDHYSFYLQPTYLLAPTTGVFLKVGYNSTKAELRASNGQSQSGTFDGVGYGLGVKTFVNQNVYLQAEASWVDYGSKQENGADFKVKASSGTVSLGYQF